MAAKKRKSTKKKELSDLVGAKKQMTSQKLPSNRDVLRFYLWLDGNCFGTIVKSVLEIWNTTGITTVTRAMVLKLLKKLHYEFRHYGTKQSATKKNPQRTR